MKRRLVELTDATEARNREAFEQHANTANRGEPTRGEIEARLREQGLSQEEAAILYASEILKQPLREIAREHGKRSPSTVANILRRAKAKRRAGSLATTTTEATTLPGLLADLREILANERQAAWHYCGTRQILRADQSPTGATEHVFKLCSKLRDVTHPCPPKALARKIVACIRDYPATLTEGRGLPWAEKLAEILAAMKYGSATERKEAREALALLTEGKAGNPVEYATHPVHVAFVALCGRLAALQREYRATVGTGTIAERLAKLRVAHPAELAGFTDADLQSTLNRKTLAVAVELAATASGASPDYWRDVARRQAREIKRAISGKDPCEP